MSYQNIAGTLNPGGHPGSYNGQDAYNDMLVTEDGLLRGQRTTASGGAFGESRSSELHARSADHSEWGGGKMNSVFDARGNGNGDVSPTIAGDHQDRVTDYTALNVEAFRKQGHPRTADGDPQKWTTTTTTDTLNSFDNSDARTPTLIVPEYAVRRLTPTECERLQGYPDGWTDIGVWVDSKGKKRQTTDSARYKALGNSICLPPWKWVLKRICAQYERDATMASLFDGIGGFPKIWEELNGPGTAVWASEIEEFCIAVTKRHFPEEAQDG